MMNVNILLYEIKAINDKYDLINKKTGGYFNIFEIANISTDEVIICRVIHELLSPNGKHYQGILYLRTFIKEVLKIDMSDNEIATANVYREYKTKERRRIDLVIETKKYFIPIEVKIYAGEQKDQCVDYSKYSSNANLYYLTRFGDLPSEYSTLGVVNTITPISFETDILKWLDTCLTEKDTIKIAPIREIILQLVSTIRSFTNKMEDEKVMEIKNLIMKSPEHMRSANDISIQIEQCKKDMMKKLLEAIEKEAGITKLYNEYDYADKNYSKIEGYYDYKKSTWPGISYYKENVKSNVKPNVDLWARIEIDNSVFIGYCVVENNKRISLNTKNEIFKEKGTLSNDWWLEYEYILESTVSDSPNFKNANEALFQLFDEDKFNNYVKKCVEKINEFTKKKQ